MISAAERIKDAVTMTEVARFYGLQTDRNGNACCPFHQERTASLHIYKGRRGWYCYGCGRGGDVIAFVRQLFNLSFWDTLAKLNEDFHVGLSIRREMTPRQRLDESARMLRERKAKQEHERELQAAKESYNQAADYWAVLDTIKRRTAPAPPKSFDDDVLALFEFSDIYATALHELPIAEYYVEKAEAALYEAERQVYADE